MKILNLEQGTQEWLDARRCMITGTRMDSVVGTPLDRLMLACELIAEEMSEQSKVMKVTPEMERGTAEEVFARQRFMSDTGKAVEEIGFCVSDEFDYVGVSGDGWIKNDGVLSEAIEIKSPDTKTAVFYQLADKLAPEVIGLGSWSKPTKAEPEPVFKPSAKAPFLGIPSNYKSQVLTYFIVNENLKKLYFCVYDQRFVDDKSKMYIIEVNRDNELLQDAIKEYKEAIVSFRAFWLDCRKEVINDNF
jgi:hypothetical protein